MDHSQTSIPLVVLGVCWVDFHLILSKGLNLCKCYKLKFFSTWDCCRMKWTRNWWMDTTGILLAGKQKWKKKKNFIIMISLKSVSYQFEVKWCWINIDSDFNCVKILREITECFRSVRIREREKKNENWFNFKRKSF